MKKKIITLLIIISSITAISVAAYAATSGTVDIFPNLAKVVIDGQKTNVETVLFKDKVYIAARDLSNELGIKVSWDGNSNTVSLTGASKLKGTKPSIIQAFLYIISRSLQFAGIILLFQVAFFRAKKDYFFIRKYSTSQTSLRRLAHTAGTTRMGTYYVLIGTIITFFVSGSGLSLKVGIPFTILLTLIFWFLGLGAANTTTKQNSIFDEDSESRDSYN